MFQGVQSWFGRSVRRTAKCAAVMIALGLMLPSFAAAQATVDPDAAAATAPAAAPATAPATEPAPAGAPPAASKPADAGSNDQSMLEFYFNALGWRYIIAFGAMSFWFVALAVADRIAISPL